MLSNTNKRILSALVMATIVFVCGYYGVYSLSLFIGCVGILMNDEIIVHFLRNDRFNLNYCVTQIVFIVPFVYLNFFLRSIETHYLFNSICMGLNIALLIYLFFLPMESNLIERIGKKLFGVIGLFTLLPMISLTTLLYFKNWQLLIFLLFIVNFGMDTGAWFFGRSLGRRKLWPKISPNKTIEGLVGGMMTAGILGHFVWLYCFDRKNLWIIPIFALLGLVSQLGDLVQSKLKRQFMIKDSSSLIPGHGGVYDRIDSLVFVLPFFVAMISYYY